MNQQELPKISLKDQPTLECEECGSKFFEEVVKCCLMCARDGDQHWTSKCVLNQLDNPCTASFAGVTANLDNPKEVKKLIDHAIDVTSKTIVE